ncbi:SMC-Scp complex subunit ScpB [bacterium]|nr:SMC-Scp complex subunit ScpB [bacterium]
MDPIKSALEAVLFVSDDPLPLARLTELFGDRVSREDVAAALAELLQDCTQPGRGVSLVEVAGGYQFYTKPQNGEFVRRMIDKRKKAAISGAALETLAIVAYRQPISRAEIEAIRGVSSEGVLHNLLEKRMIKIAGRKDVPGRPFLYRTTRQFLEYFGLNSLLDLPKIDELARALSDAEEGELFSSDEEREEGVLEGEEEDGRARSED